MKKTFITVTLELEIYDAERFRQAAIAQALKEDDAEFNAESLTDCAQMLFDPGSGPAGCDIVQSRAERTSDKDD